MRKVIQDLSLPNAKEVAEISDTERAFLQKGSHALSKGHTLLLRFRSSKVIKPRFP